MGKYDDIINHLHHESRVRTRMPIENRAAQFASFAALSGHEEAISEIAVLTQEKTDLTNEEKQAVWRRIEKSLTLKRPISISYFSPNKTKRGGSYNNISGIVVKVDEYDKTITMDKGKTIQLENIITAII